MYTLVFNEIEDKFKIVDGDVKTNVHLPIDTYHRLTFESYEKAYKAYCSLNRLYMKDLIGALYSYEFTLIKCDKCNKFFPFTLRQSERFEKLGFSNPKRCYKCR